MSTGMKHFLTIMAAAVVCLLSCKTNTSDMNTVYDFTALSNKGKEVNFADYQGKVLLIVNTASK